MRLHRVIADRLQRGQVDVALAGLQRFLPGPWPRTSAEGEYTRSNSNGSENVAPSSNAISSRRDCLRTVSAVGIGVGVSV